MQTGYYRFTNVIKKNNLFYFPCMGILSGFVCGAGEFFLPDIEIIINYYPSTVLGVFLFLSGSHLTYTHIHKNIFPLIVLIIFCSLGWRFAVSYAYSWGGPVPYLNAGAVGAFMVALGWIFAWQIKTGILKYIFTITISGVIGGLAYQLIDSIITMGETLSVFVLFIEWQTLLFLGIAMTITKKDPLQGS